MKEKYNLQKLYHHLFVCFVCYFTHSLPATVLCRGYKVLDAPTPPWHHSTNAFHLETKPICRSPREHLTIFPIKKISTTTSDNLYNLHHSTQRPGRRHRYHAALHTRCHLSPLRHRCSSTFTGSQWPLQEERMYATGTRLHYRQPMLLSTKMY